MSFLFRTDVIFYNAFSAAQGITDYLSYDQTVSFCALLNKNIKNAFESRNMCCNAIFDLNTNDTSFFDSDDNAFIRINDGVLYFGGEIGDKKLGRINACYEETELIEIIDGARNEFRSFLDKKSPMQDLRSEARLLTVI